MNMKHIWLAGVAIAALTGGAVVAQAAAMEEETAATRELNLDQLDKARDGSSNVPAPITEEDARDTDDGQGGPELEGPPDSDEGMTDDDASEPDAEDDTMPDDEPAPLD